MLEKVIPPETTVLLKEYGELLLRIQNLRYQVKELSKIWTQGQICSSCKGTGRLHPMDGGPPLYLGIVNSQLRLLALEIATLPHNEEVQKLKKEFNSI